MNLIFPCFDVNNCIIIIFLLVTTHFKSSTNANVMNLKIIALVYAKLFILIHKNNIFFNIFSHLKLQLSLKKKMMNELS